MVQAVIHRQRTFENLLKLATMARSWRTERIYLNQIPWEAFK